MTCKSLLMLLSLLMASCGGSEAQPRVESDQPDQTNPTSAHQHQSPDGVSEFRIVDVFDLGRSDVRNFAFAPASRRLYVSFTDPNRRDSQFHEWDVVTGQLTHSQSIGRGYMCDTIAVSPSGDQIVVGCWPYHYARRCRTVLVDRRADWRMTELATEGRVYAIVFAEDENTFWVSCSPDKFACNRKGERIKGEPPIAPSKEHAPGSVFHIEGSKRKLQTAGLYYRDEEGTDHRLSREQWNDNFCLSKDGRWVVATTWRGEIVVWRTSDREEVFRRKLSNCVYLAHDAERNRVLLGDASSDGTTYLRALLLP